MPELSTIIAAQRFGLGVRPGEARAIAADPEAWLLAQLSGGADEPASLRGLPDSRQAFVLLGKLKGLKASERMRKSQAAEIPEDVSDPFRALRRELLASYLDYAQAGIQAASTTETPFLERLVRFWANHFCLSADKLQVSALAGPYIREAIRPHVLGRFVDLLVAAESHPGMLLYLDNAQSIGPGSAAARFAARKGKARGLNENLAREILELHTLGVRSGYTQADVTAFAKVLTGWSIGGGEGRRHQGEPGTFQFRELLHEPGAQTVLGRRYAQDGQAQGLAVLTDLARDPRTIRHLSTQLVRHFIADTPPESAVVRLEKAWAASDGELVSVYRALVACPEAWAAKPAKLKTPEELLIGAHRALGRSPDNPEATVAALVQLGQKPMAPGAPAGWPDTAADWSGADALMKRAEWAMAFADHAGDAIEPVALAEAQLGPWLDTTTRTALKRAASGRQGLALLFASPAFQWR